MIMRAETGNFTPDRGVIHHILLIIIFLCFILYLWNVIWILGRQGVIRRKDFIDTIVVVQYTVSHFGNVLFYLTVNYSTCNIQKNIADKVVKDLKKRKETISKEDPIFIEIIFRIAGYSLLLFLKQYEKFFFKYFFVELSTYIGIGFSFLI